MDNVSHQIGYIDSHPYKIACYYFSVKTPIKPALLFMDIWTIGLYHKIIGHLLMKNINIVAIDLPDMAFQVALRQRLLIFVLQTLRDVFHVFAQAVTQPCCLMGQIWAVQLPWITYYKLHREANFLSAS